jgi:DNA repair protein RadD
MMEQRWYQDAAEFSIFDYFERGNNGNPLVAMPTGTGKSVVIAKFLRKVFEQWPNQRVMMLTHDQKLIVQNAEKFLSLWKTAPIGIYSAGLNSRDTIMPIIFGGVQSVCPAIERAQEEEKYKPEHLRHFGWRDLILIDECHLVSDKEVAQYQKIITELKKINPYLKIIGFTATPYRMRMGSILDNGIFTDICFDITGLESFNRLIAEGWLSPLVVTPTKSEIDTSAVNMSSTGDFNQKQLESETDKIIYEAVASMIEMAYDRTSRLIFTCGINNCENLASVFQSMGVEALAVHSKLHKKVNEERIEAYKAGELKWIINSDMLTTGFDHPPTDFIGMMRATLSPGLWVQMLGRGTRPSLPTFKKNCLVADFAKNAPRLGPINDPVLPRKPGKGGRDAPIKICNLCGVYNHASVRHCAVCGNEFIFESKIFSEAGTSELIRGDSPEIEFLNVNGVIYNLHEKKDSPPMIKVTYYCGFIPYSEYVCLEHPGFPGKRSRDWWRLRHKEEPPSSTWEALQRVSELRKPSKIKVWVNKKYPEILSHEW